MLGEACTNCVIAEFSDASAVMERVSRRGAFSERGLAMKCRECGEVLERIDTEHLLVCCGLTLQEYALRYHVPLDFLVSPDQIEESQRVPPCPVLVRYPSDQARAVLQGLRIAGWVKEENELTVVSGDVRTLDLLLWDLSWLREYGFCFRQDYSFGGDAHRVVARNRLVVQTAHLRRADGYPGCPVPPPDLLDVLAVCVAHSAVFQRGYLFWEFPERSASTLVREELLTHHGITLIPLDAISGTQNVLLRAQTTEDTERLRDLLGGRMRAMPGVVERFGGEGPCATVVKELVFDAAHFITDHPEKCSNLHGGRYVLQVKVHDRIDPVTGCVVDYGYLKRVVSARVIQRFDHHTLNYVASELAWRSSTEMLCVFIWEQLIDYLPGLQELKLFETTQSWCSYTGPDLAKFQSHGTSTLYSHFSDRTLGTSALRRLIRPQSPPSLRAVDHR
jgi:6-pyruvoyl tetrahydropterin synthase/QueD family protein